MDGTASDQQWRTTFTLTNRGKAAATVRLELFDNGGTAMTTGIGSVRDSAFRITLPAGGTRSYTTNGDGAVINNGWAILNSSHPISAIATVIQTQSGSARTETIVESAIPTFSATAAVSANTTLSIANVFNDLPTNVVVTAKNNDGVTIMSVPLTIPALGRSSFPLPERFQGMPPTFTGSLQISGETPDDIFVAALVDRDRVGGLRGGRTPRIISPASHYDNLWLTYKRILAGAKANLPDVNLDDIDFRVRFDKVINAYAANGKEISIYVALAQLINDSPSEMAFVIAHELGHILQQRTGALLFNPNPEFDADSWGVLFSLMGGYDPYGSAGALSRLAMATGRAGLVSQFEDQSGDDAHKSFNERLSTLYDLIGGMCASSETAKQACDTYKSVMHPNLPSAIPLAKPGARLSNVARERVEPSGPASELP